MSYIDSDDWTATLDTNGCGRKILTLPRALQLASQRNRGDWYVAPFATEWTIGRQAPDGGAYHVVVQGEPIRFDCQECARDFLQQLLPKEAEVRIRLPQSL